jgi:low affinity Fe/Cu permease
MNWFGASCVTGAMKPSAKRSRFSRFAEATSAVVGSSAAFGTAVGIIVVWAVLGPVFGYSDTWQLWINTGTTIVTFLMVFMIQHTQNRDAMAVQLKLDELLRALQGARTEMVNVESLSDEELARLRKAFDRLAQYASRPRDSEHGK